MSDNAAAFHRLLELAHARGAGCGTFLDVRDLTPDTLDKLAENERGALCALALAGVGEREAVKIVAAFDEGLAARRKTVALLSAPQ